MNFGMQVPEKSGYKFNEITSLTGVKPYVLRFWETEFPQISPIVDDSGQKVYDKSDLLAVKTVKKLLFKDKLSIPEARAILDNEMDAVSNAVVEEESEKEAVDLKERSLELKNALEEIVEKGTSGHTSGQIRQEEPLVSKASPLASRIRREVKARERAISDRDVVNLVSAKKKLNKLLGVINDLEKKYGW